MKTTRSAKRMIALITAFALSFSSMLSVMTTETYAASAKAPAKVGGVTGTGSGQTYASIKWKKIKKNKNTKGYTVYRNGAAVGSVGKGASSFTDYNLAPGRTYTYQVRAYNTYKEKRWYNKKTGRYQKKKPAKKNRGKSKKFTRYKFGKASAATYVATKARANSASTGSSTGGNTGGETSSPYPVGSVLECTDYKGYVYKSTKISSTSWRNENTGSNITESSAISRFNNPQCNHTKDGSWGSGTSAMKQVSGATFKATIFNDPKFNSSWGVQIEGYNVDASKLRITPGSGVSTVSVNSYLDDSPRNNPTPYKKYYFVKNGNKIAETSANPLEVSSVNKGSYTMDTMLYTIYRHGSVPTSSLGIFNDIINVTVTYDNKSVGVIPVDTCRDQPVAYDSSHPKMSPKRALALDVAKAGVGNNGNGTGNLDTDLKNIAAYIEATYDHNSKPNATNSSVSGYGLTVNFGCEWSSYILESWAVYKYGDEVGRGFFGWGSSTSADHSAFHLDSDPYNYYEVWYRNWH